MKEVYKSSYNASVKCDPTSKPVLEHNDRTDSRAKNIHKELSHDNEYSCTAAELKTEWQKLYNEAKEIYMATSKRKDKFTKKDATLCEMVYELNPASTMQDCQNLTQEIAKLTGFTPLQIAIHRDEGHKPDDENFQKHYHAHVVFFTLDKDTGKQLKRQQAALSKKNLSTMQDLAAEILSNENFKMQRGERRYEYNKEAAKFNAENEKAIKQGTVKAKEFKNKTYTKSIKDHAKNEAIKQRNTAELKEKEEELTSREQAVQHQHKINQQTINELGEDLQKLREIENIDKELQQKKAELEKLTREKIQAASIELDYKKLIELDRENQRLAKENHQNYEPKFTREIKEESEIKQVNEFKHTKELTTNYTLKGTDLTLEAKEEITAIDPYSLKEKELMKAHTPTINKVKKKNNDRGWSM